MPTVWRSPKSKSLMPDLNVWSDPSQKTDPTLDPQYWFKKVMARAYSPEEFDKLPDEVKGAFFGYMGYLNAFASKRKAKSGAASAFQATQAGTFQPQNYNIAVSKTSGSTRRIPSASSASGTPQTRRTIHRSLSGMPTIGLAGQGVTRGLGGELIPQTPEQVAAQGAIARDVGLAVPRQQEITANEVLKLQLGAPKREMESIATRDALDIARKQSKLTPDEKFERTQSERLFTKLGLDSDKFDEKVRQFGLKQAQKITLQTMRTNARVAASELKWKQRGLNDKAREDLKRETLKIQGKFPDTPEGDALQAQIVQRSIDILDKASENRMDEFARKELAKERSYWVKMRTELEKIGAIHSYSQSIDETKLKALMDKAESKSDALPPVPGAEQVEVSGQVIWAIKQPNGKWRKVQ